MNRRPAMTCDEFKDLAAAYALTALDDQDRRACARHLASGVPHRGCTEAVEQAALVAARLGGALTPVVPPARVWQNIAAEVRGHRAGGPVPVSFASATAIEEARRRGVVQICGWLVAVALLGLYLYTSPFDSRRRQPAALGTSLESESSLHMHGGQAPAAQLVAPLAH